MAPSSSFSRFLVSPCISVGHLKQTLSTDANIPRSTVPLYLLIPLTSLVLLEIRNSVTGQCCRSAPCRGCYERGRFGHEDLLQEPKPIKKMPIFVNSFWFCNPSQRWGGSGQLPSLCCTSPELINQVSDSSQWSDSHFSLFLLDAGLHHWSQELRSSGLAEEQRWFLSVLMARSGHEDVCTPQTSCCS